MDLDSRLELEALKYREELNHVKNIEQEFVNVQGIEENSYIAKSNSDRSIENVRKKTNSYKGDFRKINMKHLPAKFLHLRIKGKISKLNFLAKICFLIKLKRHLF